MSLFYVCGNYTTLCCVTNVTKHLQSFNECYNAYMIKKTNAIEIIFTTEEEKNRSGI